MKKSIHSLLFAFALVSGVALADAAAPAVQAMAPQLLSVCSGDKASLCLDGKPVVLRGANAPHLLWGVSKWSGQWATLDHLMRDVATLKEWGGNFVIINFDPGRVGNFDYAQQIVSAVTFARMHGLHVGLMQHHARWEMQGDNIVLAHLPIVDTDAANYQTDAGMRWLQLLSHPGVAEALSENVDIFGVFSEPSKFVSSGTGGKAVDITWSQWRPRAEKICLDIRNKIKRQSLCSISGINWGWDLRGLAAEPFAISSVVAEFHQYQKKELGQTYNFTNSKGQPVTGHVDGVSRQYNWQSLVGKYPLLMGEFGSEDSADYVRDLIADAEKNQVSWAAWSLIGWKENNGMIYFKSRDVFLLGQVVKNALSK